MKPTHVFASLSPQSLCPGEKLPENQKRKVEVSGSATLTVSPEISILSIIVSSKKEKACDARCSVERRVDYVKQTLLNNGILEDYMTITENLKHVTDGYLMETQIDATFYSALQKCMKLSSLFVEKLQHSVKVLPPILKHHQQRLECQRKKACLLAFANARQKALDLCRMLNQNLGRPITVIENNVNETKGSEKDENTDEADLDAEKDHGVIDVQRRMRKETVHLRVDVTATFELKSKSSIK